MVGVRFPLKVQKDLYWRNWYTAIEGEGSGNSPEMVTGSNPVYKSFNYGVACSKAGENDLQSIWEGSIPFSSTYKRV